jgi:hypothetical protein
MLKIGFDLKRISFVKLRCLVELLVIHKTLVFKLSTIWRVLLVIIQNDSREIFIGSRSVRIALVPLVSALKLCFNLAVGERGRLSEAVLSEVESSTKEEPRCAAWPWAFIFLQFLPFYCSGRRLGVPGHQLTLKIVEVGQRKVEVLNRNLLLILESSSGCEGSG